MSYLIYFYEDKFDELFKNDILYFNGYMIDNFCYYFLLVIYLCFNDLEFYMYKKFEFLNWFKLCKSCLIKKMIRKISVLILS